MTYAAIRLMSLAGVCVFATLAMPAPAHADDGETITACVTRDGRVRISSPGSGRNGRKAGCRPDERIVTWSVAGPRGPAGEPGAEGPAGPPGPPGPGLSGVQYYTVGVGDLRPATAGIFGTSFGPPPGGSFSTAAAPLLAAIHVPQGARIAALRAHVFDNSTSDLRIELIEQPLSGELPGLVSAVVSSGAAGAAYAIEDVFTIPHIVDNERFHYFVRILPAPGWTGTTLQAMGATIAYTLPAVPES